MNTYITYSFVLYHDKGGLVCKGMEELKEYLEDGYIIVQSYQFEDCVFVILKDTTQTTD